MTHDLQQVWKNFDQGRMTTNGQRIVVMRSYKEEPQELLQVLVEAKTGAASFSKQVEEKVKAGGRLWD
jgi:N-acetylglucosamine kinase-like BadF-type ATPase